MDVDWQHGAEHMRAGHQVTVEQANEALADVNALLFDPDPGSRSGERTADWLLAYRRRGARVDPRTPRGQVGSVVGRQRLARQQYGQTHIPAEDRRKGQQQ